MTSDDARRNYKPAPGGREALRLLAAGVLALSAGACSLSFPMTSLVNDEPSTTASIAQKPVSPLSPDLGDEDWRRA